MWSLTCEDTPASSKSRLWPSLFFTPQIGNQTKPESHLWWREKCYEKCQIAELPWAYAARLFFFLGGWPIQLKGPVLLRNPVEPDPEPFGNLVEPDMCTPELFWAKGPISCISLRCWGINIVASLLPYSFRDHSCTPFEYRLGGNNPLT